MYAIPVPGRCSSVNFSYLIESRSRNAGLTFVANRVEINSHPPRGLHPHQKGQTLFIFELLRNFWSDDEGQDIAEYAVMLAVILVIVVGTIRLVGTQANNVFSETASAIGG